MASKKVRRKPRLETVEIDDFIAELDLVMHQLEDAKRQACKARDYAVDGKIPMYGMFSWRIVVDRTRSLHNSFQKAWPLILRGQTSDV